KALDFYKEAVKKGNYYGYAQMGSLFALQRHFENARKCYKAFFETRAKYQDPLVEEDPERRRFAHACYRYIVFSLNGNQPIEFIDQMKPAAQDIADIVNEIMEGEDEEMLVSFYKPILYWIKETFNV